jgi:hypothetical protein
MVKKIQMDINETLELDYVIEQITNDVVEISSEPSPDALSLSYISKETSVLNPTETGIYKLDIKGQTIEIEVTDIPDSAVSRPDDNNSDGRTSADGVEFVLADDFTENGYRISNNTSGATRARVIDLSDGSTIATKDISTLGAGDAFTIAANYQGGQSYSIVLDAEGSTYTQGFKNFSAEGQEYDGPYQSQDIDIIGGVAKETNNGAAIANIIEVGNVGFS